MEFSNFVSKMQENFDELVKGQNTLFEVALDKDELWNLYLDSFPKGTNEIFRQRREYDCSACRQFIRSFGNAVVIKDCKVHTIWEFNTGSETFQPVVDALDAFVKSKLVTDVYVARTPRMGIASNYEIIDGHSHRWDHLTINLPERLINKQRGTDGDIKNFFRSTKEVFKRSLDEISKDSVEVVLELIAQNSLYRGAEWKSALEEFLKYKNEYMTISDEDKNNYTWEKSIVVGPVVGRIRNHSMGTLLTNLSANMPLDEAVKKYEDIVAGVNYKRPKPIFTQRMLDESKQKITELGYMDSLGRRYATLDDITVNNILFANRDAAKRIDGADIFAQMSADLSINPQKFSRVEEVTPSEFIGAIVPTAKEMEVFLENKHASNMVSLIAPINKEAPTMFKWDNPFCWAYSGNVADSSIRENVKAAGGRVDGVLRFSIQWNDLDYDRNDLDAHCKEPSGEHIFYASTARKPGRSRTGGQLDVDITRPQQGIPAVENITWPDKSKMKPGVYRFYVHNFANRGGKKGFRAEIEFDGKIYSFDYPTEVRRQVDVAEVILDKDGNFSIKEKLPSSESSREVWNLHTNQFIPVSAVMFSPNYWDEQTGTGNKHLFFMLKDCINTESPNGFYNEYLKSELIEHRRVMEALGSKLSVQNADDQLSGIGFSLTKRAELIVKVKGATERIVKIKF